MAATEEPVKVRILNDTIPQWLRPHLDGHQVTVGRLARAEVWIDLDGHDPVFFPPAKEYKR
jgi:hypothetical protein